MKKSSAQLVAEAEREIETLPVEVAMARFGDDETLFVDLREKGELRREGRIPGALSVPRGLLEFWVDPQSPYFNQAFAENKKLVLFCAMGWRSALATKSLVDMGMENVSHIGGGFTAWKQAGGAVDEPASAG